MQAGAFVGYLSFGFIAEKIGRRLAFILYMVGAAILVPIYGAMAREPEILMILGPLLGQVARPCIRLTPSREAKRPRIAYSHFGGAPDLPESVSWPTLNGEYLIFLAQISLGEMPRLTKSLLPQNGMLYFFLGND